MMQDHDESENDDTFLTERQIKVLLLRHKGCSQQEVADILGTTRSNISILEKRANQNIDRARNTLHRWMTIQAPISLRVPKGTDVFDIPAMIFASADEKSIQLPVTSLDIIDRLRKEAPQLFKKRALLHDIEIYATEEGELIIQKPSQSSL
jgi:Tfx family DNA-binding protein